MAILAQYLHSFNPSSITIFSILLGGWRVYTYVSCTGRERHCRSSRNWAKVWPETWRSLKNIVLNLMLIRYLLDVIRIKIIRSALLAEVHTYNRRYSGEPRTLMEMIRCLPKESLIWCERFPLKIRDLIPQRSPCAAPAPCALPVQWGGPAPRLPTQVLSTFVLKWKLISQKML